MASDNISFDNIPSSVRKPGKYFEFNTRLAVNTLPQNRQKVLIVAQRLALDLETAEVFYGAGLNDMTPGGDFTGAADRRVVVEVDAAAATDTIKYSLDNGATWAAEGVAMTGAAQALGEGITVTFAATTGHTAGDQWVFDVVAEPEVAELVPTEVFSDADVARFFGYGSQVHLMARAALAANAYLAMTVCALDDADAAVKATGTVVVDAAATASGTLTLWVGNQAVRIAVASGDTASDIATALNDQMWEQNDLPVRAKVDAADATQINITAKNGGTVGNQIDLAYEAANSAVTLTITAMASGSGDPDLADALAAVFDEQYHLVAVACNDADNLDALRDHLEAVSGPMEQRPGRGVYGYDGPLASATTLATAVNDGRVVCAYLRGTRSTAMELAAAFAAVMAWEEDPARPLNGLVLEDIHAPAVGQRLSRTEQESLLYNGVTPLEVNASEEVAVVRAITTYVRDAQGVEDVSLLDATTIATLDYVRKAVRERIALRFPREKLNSRTPARVRSEILDVLEKLEALEIVEEVGANADGVVVERDLQDVNRLDAKIPVDVVNGLHVFAGRIDLLL